MFSSMKFTNVVLTMAFIPAAASAQDAAPDITISGENMEAIVVVRDGPGEVAGAIDAAERIQRLDRQIAANESRLAPEQLETVRSFRDFAAYRLQSGIAEAVDGPGRAFPAIERRRILDATRGSEFAMRQFASDPHGSNRVRTEISGPQNWSLAYMTYEQYRQGGHSWTPYTFGNPLEIKRYTFRLSGTSAGAAVTCDRDLPVWDDPTRHSVAC